MPIHDSSGAPIPTNSCTSAGHGGNDLPAEAGRQKQTKSGDHCTNADLDGGASVGVLNRQPRPMDHALQGVGHLEPGDIIGVTALVLSIIVLRAANRGLYR